MVPNYCFEQLVIRAVSAGGLGLANLSQRNEGAMKKESQHIAQPRYNCQFKGNFS
jgi:hypothetical protein